jgi:hypothetical protein
MFVSFGVKNFYPLPLRLCDLCVRSFSSNVLRRIDVKIKFNVLVFLFFGILGAAFALGTKESNGGGTTTITPVQQPRTPLQAQQPMPDGNEAGTAGIADAFSTFTDPRDGRAYRTVKIGNLTWLAENLKYETEWGSNVNGLSGHHNEYLELYGRLYTLAAALEACPPGWRLPTRSDWDDLAQAVGGTKKVVDKDFFYWEDAGKKLKTKTGWDMYFVRNDWPLLVEEFKHKEPIMTNDIGKGYDGNGTDDFNFSAPPGALRSTAFGMMMPGTNGYWWTTDDSTFNRGWIVGLILYQGHDDLIEYDFPKDFRLSVRCVRN